MSAHTWQRIDKVKILPFEQPLKELNDKIEELERLSEEGSVDLTKELERIKTRAVTLKKEIYSQLTPAQIIQIARHPNRPDSTTRNTALFKKNRRTLLEGQPPCHWCGLRTATTADHLIEEDRWDHTQPGLNELDNLVASCKPCNSSRGAKYRNIKHSHRHTPSLINEQININTKNSNKIQTK